MTSITNAVGILLLDVIRCPIATINPPMVGVLLIEVTITDITGILMNTTDGLLGRYNSPPLHLHCISSSSNISIWLEGRLIRELFTSLRVLFPQCGELKNLVYHCYSMKISNQADYCCLRITDSLLYGSQCWLFPPIRHRLLSS